MLNPTVASDLYHQHFLPLEQSQRGGNCTVPLGNDASSDASFGDPFALMGPPGEANADAESFEGLAFEKFREALNLVLPAFCEAVESGTNVAGRYTLSFLNSTARQPSIGKEGLALSFFVHFRTFLDSYHFSRSQVSGEDLFNELEKWANDRGLHYHNDSDVPVSDLVRFGISSRDNRPFRKIEIKIRTRDQFLELLVLFAKYQSSSNPAFRVLEKAWIAGPFPEVSEGLVAGSATLVFEGVSEMTLKSPELTRALKTWTNQLKPFLKLDQLKGALERLKEAGQLKFVVRNKKPIDPAAVDERFTGVVSSFLRKRFSELLIEDLLPAGFSDQSTGSQSITLAISRVLSHWSFAASSKTLPVFDASSPMPYDQIQKDISNYPILVEQALRVILFENKREIELRLKLFLEVLPNLRLIKKEGRTEYMLPHFVSDLVEGFERLSRPDLAALTAQTFYEKHQVPREKTKDGG